MASARLKPRPAIRPNATFSQTGSESNSAPPWNSMPNLCMISSRSPDDMRVTSWPSISIEPLSGFIRPMMHLISTDLPVPEPPITTSDWPFGTSRSRSLSTTLRPKALHNPRTLILMSLLIGRRTAP